MEERRTYSVLDYVRSQKSSDICRFIFWARITSPDRLLKLFATCRNEKSASSVTGILLVYQRYVVHLLEGPEDEMFEMCSRFVDAEPSCLGDSKCFPTQANVDVRFFDKWRARKVAGDCGNFEKYDESVEDFDNVKKIYCTLVNDLYEYCDELRASRTIGRACFIDKLEGLASERDSRLPEVRTLELILQSRWGESLDNFMRDYRRGVSSADVEELVWPFPANPCLPIDTIK